MQPPFEGAPGQGPTLTPPPYPPAPPAPEVPHMYCFACGSLIDMRAEICPKCGVRQRPAIPAAVPGAPSKVTAGVLAILLGWFGAHRFYLGEYGIGILYALFSFTGIPSIIGLVEGVLILAKSDEQWIREHPEPRGGPAGCALGCLIVVAMGVALFVTLVVFFVVFGDTLPADPGGALDSLRTLVPRLALRTLPHG